MLDATTGQELPGYGAKESNVMMDADGLRLPLLWHAAVRPSDENESEDRASAWGSSALFLQGRSVTPGPLAMRGAGVL